MKSDFQVERDKALVESTAQGIFNTLRELEGGRSIHENRWPWELLQNAVDVAKSSGVDCTFILTENELTFTHNGNPFKMKEIAHLIYHGSTKTDDPEKIRFGTGFITTHLLSRKTRVRGIIEDGRRFEFELNREGTTWRHLQENMDIIEKEFLDSLTNGVLLPEEVTVAYMYPLSVEGKETAFAGLQAVKSNIPFVLALNKSLSSVTVIEKDVKTKWVKKNAVKMIDEGIIVIPIQSVSTGQEKIYFVALAYESPVQTALLLQGKSDEYTVERMETLPKLFYGFPLATTEDFPLPVIINSPAFVPKERRDGLLLGSNPQKDNLRNKELVEKGVSLFQKLVKWVSSQQYYGLNRLAKIEVLPNKEWLDSEWLKKLLAKVIINMEKCNLVKTGIDVDGKPILLSPQETYVPYDDNLEVSQKVWMLARDFYLGKLPDQEIAEDWAVILKLWSSYLEMEPSEMSEVLTLDKFALTISELVSLENLEQRFREDPELDAIGWLNEFLELIQSHRSDLLSNLNLIPCQQGMFRKEMEIFRDENIDETLKNVADLLDVGIRDKLCNKKISNVIQDRLHPYQEETLRIKIVNELKKKAGLEAEYSKDEFLRANVDLFSWLARKGKFGVLRDNFPVINRRKDKGEPEYISHLLQDKPVLKPVSLWEENAKTHADLFPSKMILSNIYDTEVVTSSIWQNLVTNHLLIGDLFVNQSEILDDLKVRKLLAEGELNDQKEHGTNDEIMVTSIAFLEDKDWGIKDTVRRSKQKATKFLKFLLEYVVYKDVSWINSISIACSCEESGASHKIHPSKWLYVLKSLEWVPISRNKEELPSTENLAPLFLKDKDLLKYLREDRPSSFLSILGVSPSQIMMALQPATEKVKLDKAFVRLLLATNSNANELNKIAQVYQNPSLRLQLEEAYDLQEKVKRNQLVGEKVERILSGLLSKSLPQEKFKVYKINRGADIGVAVDLEFDLVDQNYQPVSLEIQIEKRSFVIEVKSTHSDYVRITMPQANEAVKKLDTFMLCVIELPLGYEQLPAEKAERLVREKARFVLKIGSKLKEKFNEALEFKNKQKEIKSTPAGNVTIDTTDVQIRLRLGKKLWTEEDLPVMSFDQFTEFLLGTQT